MIPTAAIIPDPVDTLYLQRNAQFMIQQNQYHQKTQSIKILGMHFDQTWTFQTTSTI